MKKRVGKKTLVRYAAESKRWSAEMPSRAQQCLYVYSDSCREEELTVCCLKSNFGTHGIKSIRNFAKSSYKEFGVRMVIFAGYQQTPEDANPTISW